MKGAMSANDDEEKCDSRREGDVADKSGDIDGAQQRWSVIGIRKGKEGKS